MRTLRAARGGIDLALNASVLSPQGEPPPATHPVLRLGFRIAFDWRHY
jgi:hypothetical protein